MHALLKDTTIILLALLLAATATAQDLYFIEYPTQVICGQIYPVSWNSVGQPVTVNLLKAGVIEETLFTTSDGSITSFTWDVDDDDDGGIDYALQLVPTQGTSLTSGTIWVIEDEDGLSVNGQVIFASVSNGPTPSGLAPAATTVITAASSASSTASQVQETQTITFSAAETTYVFVTAVDPAIAPSSSPAAEIFTFVTNGLTFTTTINLGVATGTTTSSPGATTVPPSDSTGKGGLSGGAIAGVVVGVIIIILLIVLFWWLRRRRQRQRRAQGNTVESPVTTFLKGGRRALSNRKSAATTRERVENDEKSTQRTSLVSPFSPEQHELDTSAMMQYSTKGATAPELGGTRRHEMQAAPPRYELAAENVSVEIGSSTRNLATSSSISRAGTASPKDLSSNGSVSAATNV